MDDRNKILQGAKLTLQDAGKTIQSLYEDIETIRNSWPNILEESKLVATSLDVLGRERRSCYLMIKTTLHTCLI